MGEAGNGEGQRKFNGKLDVVSERTGRGVAKCVAKKKRNVDGRKMRRGREREGGGGRERERKRERDSEERQGVSIKYKVARLPLPSNR